jgi:hypothetical protein
MHSKPVRKGIALSTIAYMILALVTIIVVISLISDKVYPSMKKAYCSILKGIRTVFPLPSQLKTDVPSFCAEEEDNRRIESVEIDSRDPDRIAFNVAAYITACWEKTGKMDVGQETLCYELVIKDVTGIVDESRLKSYTNVPFRMANSIDRPMSIAIKYNPQQKIIEVV